MRCKPDINAAFQGSALIAEPGAGDGAGDGHPCPPRPLHQQHGAARSPWMFSSPPDLPLQGGGHQGLWRELSAPRGSPQAQALAEMLRACLHPAGGRRPRLLRLLLRAFRRQGSAHPGRKESSSGSCMCSDPKCRFFSLSWWFYSWLKDLPEVPKHCRRRIPSIGEGASWPGQRLGGDAQGWGVSWTRRSQDR